MDDFYHTVARFATAEIKVKGSRFIAEVNNVGSAENAQELLNSIRKKEHAATHHCFAYRIGCSEKQEFKYSDDGEPSGTAGKPIYDCLLGRELTNAIVVVTRYFGGTKLGTGGLARAYVDAARQALDKAGKKTVFVTDRLILQFDLKYYDQVQKVLSKFTVEQVSSDFSEAARLTIGVRKSMTKELIEVLTNLTNGQIKIKSE
ncbi:MAG TPA: YigZ family protein [candidate division Zixibacteria bacterium]|nr:YigZ family protein [candidate division Zixibacteria bacterium]